MYMKYVCDIIHKSLLAEKRCRQNWLNLPALGVYISSVELPVKRSDIRESGFRFNLADPWPV